MPPAKPSTNGLAIASLVLGVLSVIPVSIVLGIIALVQIPKRRQKGRGLAVAGIVMSILWTAGWVTVIIAAVLEIQESTNPERDASGQIKTRDEISIGALRPGDCIAKIDDGDEVDNVRAVPCAEANGGKVFAKFSLPAGGWPGTAAVEAKAEQGCVQRFKQPASRQPDIMYLRPTDVRWRLGDREVICLLASR